MSGRREKNFWSTLPGAVTAIAGLITALGGTLLTLQQIGWIGPNARSVSSEPIRQNATLAENTPQGAQHHLFEDSFSSAALNSKWQVITGDWYAKDGVLNGISKQKTSFGGPVWAILTLDEELPEDYTVSFRVKIIEGEVAELMLRLSNNRYVRAYLYEIDQAVMLGDGKFLRKNMPGSIGLDEIMDNLGGGTTVAEHSYPILKNRWYSVKVTARKNHFTISVGGQNIVEYTDHKKQLNAQGTIGFISNGHMQFDDVSITKHQGAL